MINLLTKSITMNSLIGKYSELPKTMFRILLIWIFQKTQPELKFEGHSAEFIITQSYRTWSFEVTCFDLFSMKFRWKRFPLSIWASVIKLSSLFTTSVCPDVDPTRNKHTWNCSKYIACSSNAYRQLPHYFVLNFKKVHVKHGFG